MEGVKITKYCGAYLSKGASERRHLLPDKIAVWCQDKLKKRFQTFLWRCRAVRPFYAAGAIR
jgi:hypothetical protein